jgi:hypothetical protein
MSRNSNYPKLKAFYSKYCKILNKVLKEAKGQYYGSLVTKFYNEIKTTWNIVKKRQEKCIRLNRCSPYS